MKKVISLLTVIAVVCSCSIGAFAFDASSATELSGTDGVYAIEAASTGDFATILAVKGTAISVGAIQYINQDVTADGKANFEFALNDELLAAATAAGIADTKVYVLTGGDGNVTVNGYIETAVEDPTYTITGSVVATIGKTLPVVKVTNGADEYTATVENDGSYTITGVPAGSYTFTITKAAHLTYTSPLTISADKAIPAITVYAGNTDGNTGINVDDFTAVGTNFGSTKDVAGEAFVKDADTDDNDGINVDDFTAVGINFGKSTSIYTAIQ